MSEPCEHDEQDHGICLHCGEDRDINSDTFGQKMGVRKPPDTQALAEALVEIDRLKGWLETETMNREEFEKLKQQRDGALATIATLRAECESKRLEILERIGKEAADRVFMDEYQDQRDAAQQALSQAYYLITGRSPQWSDAFRIEQAVQEIDDAQRLFRAECEGLRADVNAMRLGLSERIFFTGDNPNYHRHGYSLEVDSETSYGDVNIKKYDLYPTPDEAIDAFIKRMKEIIAWQASRAGTEGK